MEMDLYVIHKEIHNKYENKFIRHYNLIEGSLQAVKLFTFNLDISNILKNGAFI
jgi:hypothetical protein